MNEAEDDDTEEGGNTGQSCFGGGLEIFIVGLVEGTLELGEAAGFDYVPVGGADNFVVSDADAVDGICEKHTIGGFPCIDALRHAAFEQAEHVAAF